MYYIYMLRCKDNSIYTGITTDISRRMKEHFNKEKRCAKYTLTHSAKKLEALWVAENKSLASKLEFNIKKLKKQEKENLIKNKEIGKYSEGGTSQGLQELLDDLEKQKLITEKERETINDVGQITIGSRTIQFKEKIKIGDYVNYKPKSKTYTISKTYSGYTDNQEYTT